MRHNLPALIVATVAIATPAAACYDWQIMTCGQPETRTILDKHRSVSGYLEPQINGTVRILGKDRQVQGYIQGGAILGKDRRVHGYVEPSNPLIVEGLPRRYSPVLD